MTDSAAQPLPLDPFTMATRMCDDDGMVSETVAEDMQGLANQELRRLTYLDKVNNMRRHGGSSSVGPFACTGSAHLAGEHIRCTSPAHGKQPDYDQQSGGQVSDEPTITAASITDRLDNVSRALSRIGGMAIAAGQVEIVNAVGEAGCDLDEIINDLLDAEDAD